MKKSILLFLLVVASGFAQNLNQYKYALVPAKFSFLKETNMYNLNLLTKLYMEKYGFEAYLDNETFSDGFANENCNKVFIDVESNSNLFTTKLIVVVKDCKNNILFKSEEGKSNDKEFKVAYNLALREAFDNFNILKIHKYQPLQKSSEIIGETSKSEISSEKSDVLKKEAAQNQMSSKNYDVIVTETGYNLITVASDYKIFQIFKTSSKDIFIAKRDSISGVLIKKNESWFFEYYEENVLKSELIKVTF